jgi:cytochrome c oxidase cbb3-type subunit 1
VKATVPFHALRLVGGLMYVFGMCIMGWNVVMTIRNGKAEPVRIPAVAAHA